jgi:urease accessory protein UreE
MSLEEQSVIDQVEVTRNGSVNVRRADLVLKDGVEIAKTYHRHVLSPGDDLSKEDAKVVAIAQAAWTPEVIAAYQAQQAAREAK